VHGRDHHTVYRYPVKGLSAEPLDRVALAIGRCLPQDRRFAIALGSTHFDLAQPQWLAKTNFIMLMRDEKLTRLSTRFDPRHCRGRARRREARRQVQAQPEPSGRRSAANHFGARRPRRPGFGSGSGTDALARARPVSLTRRRPFLRPGTQSTIEDTAVSRHSSGMGTIKGQAPVDRSTTCSRPSRTCSAT
jgi:hypothetical protein